MNERYSHRFHAGNVGDVWKHTVLCAWLEPLARQAGGLTLIETHAGAGRYQLGPTGEWTEGIGKLWSQRPLAAPPCVQRYLDLEPAPVVGSSAATHSATTRSTEGDEDDVTNFSAGPSSPAFPAAAGTTMSRGYLGSPMLERALLGPDGRLILHELESDTCAELRAAMGPDPGVVIHEADGVAALPTLLRTLPSPAEVLVVIDPTYGSKDEWTSVPDLIIELYRDRPSTRVLLWYPLKSYTRPNAMLQRLGRGGVPNVALELITTPLELQKNRLNGNGVVLVNAPNHVYSEILAAAPILGLACATHAGRFTCRAVGWAAP